MGEFVFQLLAEIFVYLSSYLIVPAVSLGKVRVGDDRDVLGAYVVRDQTGRFVVCAEFGALLALVFCIFVMIACVEIYRRV